MKLNLDQDLRNSYLSKRFYNVVFCEHLFCAFTKKLFCGRAVFTVVLFMCLIALFWPVRKHYNVTPLLLLLLLDGGQCFKTVPWGVEK